MLATFAVMPNPEDLDLLKSEQFEKDGQQKKLESKWREAHGANWLLNVTMARFEHESSSYGLNATDAGRKQD